MPARLFTDEQEAEIALEYTTRLPDGTWLGGNQLAHKWGTNHRTLYNVLRRQGVKTRDARESHAYGKRCKPIKNLPVGEPPLCKCGCGKPVKWVSKRRRWDTYVTGHRTPDRPYKDRDWLYNAYVTERRTVGDIAAQFNIATTSIKCAMRRFGIECRNASESHKGIQAGDKNPAWKGGTTPERQRLYKKGEWKQLVRDVLKRDNYTCQRCKTYRATNEPKLVTHHVKPFSTHPDLRFAPDNLVTLCETCHNWVHSNANTDNEFC